MVGTAWVPPIAILSLGTGNELARVTGWGATYNGGSLVPFVRDVAGGRVVGVDSWLWQAAPLELDASGYLREPSGGGSGDGEAEGGGDGVSHGGSGGSRDSGGGPGGSNSDWGLGLEDGKKGTTARGMGGGKLTTTSGMGPEAGQGQQLDGAEAGGDMPHLYTINCSGNYDSVLGSVFGEGTGWGSGMTLNSLIAPPPRSPRPPRPPRPQRLQPRDPAHSSDDDDDDDRDEDRYRDDDSNRVDDGDGGDEATQLRHHMSSGPSSVDSDISSTLVGDHLWAPELSSTLADHLRAPGLGISGLDLGLSRALAQMLPIASTSSQSLPPTPGANSAHVSGLGTSSRRTSVGVSGGASGDASGYGTPRKSMRYDTELARAMSMSSSDLPHLPEFAFAPPPMTPPGTQVCSHRGRRHGRGGGGRVVALYGQTVRGEEEGLIGPLLGGGAGGSAEKHELVGGGTESDALEGAGVHYEQTHGGGGGGGGGSGSGSGGRKGVDSSGKPQGPVNNGVGFRRLCCRRSRAQSGGGSVDFAADGFGFDDINVDDGGSDTGDDIGVVTKMSVCFFSVGFDASIALQFHQLREATPCCADSVSKIVAGHAWLGIAEFMSSRKYLRPGVITLRVDGREVPIPPQAKTIQCFNIHSSATGINFFGAGRSRPGELQEYDPPNIGDGLVEVVATYGVAHLSAVRLGLGHSHRLAQGRVVEMVLREAQPVQVDGEPWLQPPAVIRMSLQVPKP